MSEMAESNRDSGSSTADALSAAGDAASAADIGFIDNAASAAERKMGRRRRGLVERLIFGPLPPVAELQSGARAAAELEGQPQSGVVEAALGCLARGEAFTADGRLSASLRQVVAEQKAYGYIVPADSGGAGALYTDLARVEERLAANGLGPLAVEISGQLTIGAGSVIAYGSEEQKKTYLPMLVQGRLMGFALTEVGVGVNARMIQAYVEQDGNGDYRLFAEGANNKLWITNASHGGLLGVVARIGNSGDQIGLFIVSLPDSDVTGEAGEDCEFRCEPSSVDAFTENYNSRLHFRNFPVPKENRIPADGVEVLFYCLRMGRCMLAAMSAGYQLMLARDASYYATRRDGVGGRLIEHELPRLALGKMLGGALQARSLAYLSLQQDADGVDLAGLRDLTKSAAAGAGLESMIACAHVLGGRSFHRGSRVNAARANLHLFSVVEGEDDMIRMGMVRDVTRPFVDGYLAGMLEAVRSANMARDSEPVAPENRILRIDLNSLLRHPRRSLRAVRALVFTGAFYSLLGWIIKNAASDLLWLPLRFVPGLLLPRYRSLPAPLRGYARFAERKLRGLRWSYLGLSLIFQLELTRAQVPLVRLGLCIEHLVSMLALCHHASMQDRSQHEIAALQAQLLKDKFNGIKLLSSLREMQQLRRHIAAVGEAIADDRCSILRGLDPQPFAHPWDGRE